MNNNMTDKNIELEIRRLKSEIKMIKERLSIQDEVIEEQQKLIQILTSENPGFARIF